MITTTTIITPTNIGLNWCERGQTYVVLFFWTSYDNPK